MLVEGPATITRRLPGHHNLRNDYTGVGEEQSLLCGILLVKSSEFGVQDVVTLSMSASFERSANDTSKRILPTDLHSTGARVRSNACNCCSVISVLGQILLY